MTNKGCISLWDNKDFPSVTPFLLEGSNNPCVIVCPGGGYRIRAEHEGAPVAMWLNSIGISAFVLNYRVCPNYHPAPSQDAKRAIRLIRKRAQEFGIDKQRVGILGFSAGGHLAATTGTYFEEDGLDENDEVDCESSIPNLMVLCYPVITLGEYGHANSTTNLLGDNPDEKLVYKLSLENSVTERTPRTFIWHAQSDGLVPVQNSILFAEALKKNNVEYEMHIFSNGSHGLGLAKNTKGVSQWTALCENWLKRSGF